MRTQARRAIDAVLAHSPAQPFFKRRRSGRLAALAYHGVDDPGMFERHLDRLIRIANPISLDQLLDAATGRGRLPPRPVLITFDDGEWSVLQAGLPLLKARGLPAVAFVVAGLLDTDEPYWWAEAERRAAAGGTVDGRPVASVAELIRRMKRVPDRERESLIEELRGSTPGLDVSLPQLRRSDLPVLEASGIAIGNHSLLHPCLSRCTDERIEREITESHTLLTEALGRPPRSFAYPDGIGDDRVRAALAASGYEASFLFDHRLSDLPLADPLRISRVRVDSDNDLNRFSIVLSGLHPALHHRLGRD
ncbi:MAG: polysaccharide deacetylase family protein [Actinomycetota bacterium]